MNKPQNHIHIADLVAVAEVQDLPPSLYPFVKIRCTMGEEGVDNKAHVIILKIRDTLDSYHAVIVNRGMSLEEINSKISEDLKVVNLSDEAKKTLNELIKKFNKGKFVYFLDHKLNRKTIYSRVTKGSHA